MQWSRRDVLSLTAASGTLGLAGLRAARAAAGQAVPEPLRRFIADYMAAMNAPGLTLALAGTGGTLATGTFGYVDLAARVPVTAQHRFEIGSITKSFTAIVILQLQDEGRLDVQDPILRHLPWLPIEADYGEILIHHLLTHSAGMPSDVEVLPVADAERVRQTFAPGSQFHYCNWGFAVLGRLIESLEGVPWGVAVTRRILAPLGMTDTVTEISSANRARLAPSYVPLYDDRPYPRQGPQIPAPAITFALAAGAICSTPADMARYLTMLLNGGALKSGRVLSPRGFALMSTAHIDAEEFGPGASYGYGIAVDTLQGHRRLRHTGGMVSFMSSLQLDLDAGVGAFVSINAQLGYRPNPVAQYAIQLLRAAREREAAPPPPPADEAAVVREPAEFAGLYRSAEGRMLEVRAAGERLILIADGATIPLQHDKDDQFIAAHPRFALYALRFERGAATRDAPAPVIGVGHGPDWYAGSPAPAPAPVPAGPELAPFPGLYASENPWVGTYRVVVRRGQLWLNGVIPLVALGARLFRVADEPSSPETAEFRGIVQDRAHILLIDGGVCRRVPDA